MVVVVGRTARRAHPVALLYSTLSRQTTGTCASVCEVTTLCVLVVQQSGMQFQHACAQATATAAELEALLASRRYTLLGRLLQEQPGPELMNALRAAPEDELQEHVTDFDRRNMF